MYCTGVTRERHAEDCCRINCLAVIVENSMKPSSRNFGVLLNFTANHYHWGCYGTSAEIYRTLIERGWILEIRHVYETHNISPTPANSNDFNDNNFLQSYEQSNHALLQSIQSCDVVIVNGEGTLHRSSKAALNLLYLLHLSKSLFGKPTHLINHSFYPSGSRETSTMDEVYKWIATPLDRVVPREHVSAEILTRLGVECIQGFDCLPRHVDRLNLIGSAKGGDDIVISGGVASGEVMIREIAKALNKFTGNKRRVKFLTGSKSFLAADDKPFFDALKIPTPDIEWTSAESFEEWLDIISSACCLISGRFHHSIAAASLGVPFISFSSNTTKIEAIMDMLSGPAVIKQNDLETEEKVENFIDQSLKDFAPSVNIGTIREMIKLSENNFVDL